MTVYESFAVAASPARLNSCEKSLLCDISSVLGPTRQRFSAAGPGLL